MSTYERLMQTKKEKGAGYIVLIDPDKLRGDSLPEFMREATKAGVDAFFIGGSLMLNDEFDATLRIMKQSTDRPVVIFPGSLFQISAVADAILYIVLISGRNPDHLIGNHVVASPIIKRMNLETISTGYMLIEGGNVTSAEFMSNTKPIPREKADIAAAHAIAAEMMGLKMLYLEAGSGAVHSVPEKMIGAVAKYCGLPIIAGGGIRTPEDAARKVAAGASFVVTGTVVEERGLEMIQAFADAIHGAKR